MLSTIGQWLFTIPVANPWRAIVLVLVVLAVAFILHMLWELGFSLAAGISRINTKLKASKSVSASNSTLVVPIEPNKAS